MDICAEHEQRIRKAAEYIINNNATIRQAAKYIGVSKSTVHKDLNERLKSVAPELWDDLRSVLDNNRATRHLRGGEATKNKYRQIKENIKKSEK